MPVVARMVTVGKPLAPITAKELTAQGRSATEQDALKHLALPDRHGRCKALQVIRSEMAQQLVEGDRTGLAAVGSRAIHEASGLKIAHESIQKLLVLSLAETGQVSIESGDGRAFMSEVDLDLAEVLPLFEQMSSVGMTQRVNVSGFLEAFAQTQAAGIDGGQTHPMIESGDLGENRADFLGGEDDGQFELWIGTDQLDLHRPATAKSFLPKELDGADGLSGSLTGHFLDSFEMKKVLAKFFGGGQIGRFAEELAEFAHARQVGKDGALGERHQEQIVQEAI